MARLARGGTVVEHRMILLSPCWTKIEAVVKVPRKDAGVAQVGEQSFRKRQGESSNDSTSPKIEE